MTTARMRTPLTRLSFCPSASREDSREARGPWLEQAHDSTRHGLLGADGALGADMVWSHGGSLTGHDGVIQSFEKFLIITLVDMLGRNSGTRLPTQPFVLGFVELRRDNFAVILFAGFFALIRAFMSCISLMSRK